MARMKPDPREVEDARREEVRRMAIKRRLVGKVDPRFKDVKGLESKSRKPRKGY